MDKLFEIVHWLDNLWTYIIVIVGLGGTAQKYGGPVYHKVVRVAQLSDRLYQHFGADASEKLIEELTRNSRDITLAAAQQDLVELHLDLAVFVCGPAGACIRGNNRFAELFGLDRSEWVGLGWIEGICQDEREEVHKTCMYSIANKLPYDSKFWICNRRTGERYFCELKSRPKFSLDSDELVFFLCSLKIIEAERTEKDKSE